MKIVSSTILAWLCVMLVAFAPVVMRPSNRIGIWTPAMRMVLRLTSVDAGGE
ncbi:MAG: hypothetical protein WA652_10955 [Xanthobacteraceae bacterium]